MALNVRQRDFVNHYVVLRSGKKAAIAAGYSTKGAKSIGSRLLAKPEVKAALADAATVVKKSTILEFTEGLEVLTKIIRGEIGSVRQEGDKSIKAMPTPTERTKAIETFARLSGWDKTPDVNGDTFTKPLESLSDLELERLCREGVD